MITNKFKILLTAFVLPLVLNAQTVKKLTLQEAIDLGVANSKNLKLSQNKIDEAVAKLAVVKDNVLPSASASFFIQSCRNSYKYLEYWWWQSNSFAKQS
jgi:outer membrane protein